MSDLEVRIVEMEPMRVVSARAFGPSPEAVAGARMMAFLASKGLRFEDVRWYGFNNPNPSPGTPNYGYEVWATVGPEIEGEDDITVLDIPARLYAVTHCESLETIGQDWKNLVLWFEDSPYKATDHWHQCLEHLLTEPSAPEDQYNFDLYLPVRR